MKTSTKYLRYWCKEITSVLTAKKRRLDITLSIKKIFLIRTSKHHDKPSEMTLLSDQNMMGWFVKILYFFMILWYDVKIVELHFPPLQSSTPTYGTNTVWPGEWKISKAFKLFLFLYLGCSLKGYQSASCKNQPKTVSLSLPYTQLPDCDCKWVFLQRHQRGTGKHRAANLSLPPQRSGHMFRQQLASLKREGGTNGKRADWW